jgi:murein DD-endopeptidase MepM/ murein hydrolase activator NlpD
MFVGEPGRQGDQQVRRGILAAVIALPLALTGCGTANSAAPQPTFVVPSAAASVSPLAATESATSAAPSASASPSAKPSATPAKKITYAFPVVGNNGYGHTHHDYPATDIITNCGNKVVAATAGVILTVTRKDGYKASVNAGATRGGLSVALLGDDGVRYYGSHMSVIDAKIKVGVRVTTGQTLGKTGDTGDASACHLHFGISPPCSEVSDWWIQRGEVYPWPYLDAWKKGVNKSPVAVVAAWKAKHGCPKKALVDP